MDFNRSGAELIKENIAKQPTEYLKEPENSYLLKRALDAFEERQLQRQLERQLDKKSDIG